jgi:hypothetical protein
VDSSRSAGSGRKKEIGKPKGGYRNESGSMYRIRGTRSS